MFVNSAPNSLDYVSLAANRATICKDGAAMLIKCPLLLPGIVGALFPTAPDNRPFFVRLDLKPPRVRIRVAFLASRCSIHLPQATSNRAASFHLGENPFGRCRGRMPRRPDHGGQIDAESGRRRHPSGDGPRCLCLPAADGPPVPRLRHDHQLRLVCPGKSSRQLLRPTDGSSTGDLLRNERMGWRVHRHHWPGGPSPVSVFRAAVPCNPAFVVRSARLGLEDFHPFARN